MSEENNTGKIYITISDKRGSGGGDGGNNQNPIQPKDDKEGKDFSKNYIQHQFFHFVEGQAKEFVNYTVQNIGNFQGSFQEQREMQSALSLVRSGVGIVTAFAAGGPIGGAIAIAGTIINYAYQYHTGEVMTNQQNYSIEQLKKLSGLSGLSNGSR